MYVGEEERGGGKGWRKLCLRMFLTLWTLYRLDTVQLPTEWHLEHEFLFGKLAV